jgi:hypothetical protein
MYCPRCGSEPSENLKFCKSCGANLLAVRRAVDTKDSREGKVRGKPWYAEMTLSDAEAKRRQVELYHQRGIAPEVTRNNEIKAGIITGSVGIAIAIFTNIFMTGLILSGSVSPSAAQILSRVWIAGVIPIFIGLALIINGVFVTKRLADLARRAAQPGPVPLKPDTDPLAIGAGETTEFVPASFSVTEDTTKHLSNQPQHRQRGRVLPTVA